MIKRVIVIVGLLLVALPTTPAFDPACESPLLLLHFEASWEGLDSTVENPTPWTQSGGLVVDFLMNGQQQSWWFGGLSLAPNSRWRYEIRFPATITVIGVQACEQKGSGIVDAPDPVASKVKRKKVD